MMRIVSRRNACLLATVAGLALAGASRAAPATDASSIIGAATELRLSYPLALPPSRLIADRAQLLALAQTVDELSAAALAAQPGLDAPARRALHLARRTAALVRGDAAAAEAQDRAATGGAVPTLETDLLAALLRAGPAPDPRRVARIVGGRLARRGAADRDGVVALRRELALASSAFRLGEIRAFADPEWSRTPAVSHEFAVALLRLWVEIELRNPHRETIERGLVAWLAWHPAPSDTIWTARDLPAAPDGAPAVIGIWDGVDVAAVLPPSRRAAAAPAGAPLAFDDRYRETTGALLPLPPDVAARLGDYERYMRGIGDLAAGRDSPDVAFARDWRQRLTPDAVEAFERGYGWYTDYIHGTHVAGVAVRDLPAVDIVPVRISFPQQSPPPLLEEAAANRFAAMVERSVGHMRSRGVRLCNISWGFTQRAVEDNLIQNRAEAGDAAAARAARIFGVMYAAMTRAMAGAPEILFVVAAGNAEQDVDAARDLPGSINLPNVLTVGAADEAGRVARFASTGASVDLYALGTNVESVVPGGGRLRWSGASLAAPQVINGAARLLARHPTLTAADLARLLVETATPAAGAGVPLLDVRAADARLKRESVSPPPRSPTN